MSSIIIDNAIELFGGTEKDWRTVGGAAVHRNAVISGGTIRGNAVIRGGTISGGEISGGTISGNAVIRGGTISGGWISGGTYTRTPIQLFGACEWPVVVQGDLAERVSVGCECHTWDEWWKNGEAIAEKHNTEWPPVERALRMAWQMVECG